MKTQGTAVLPRVTVIDSQSRLRVSRGISRRIVRTVISGEHAGAPGEITVCFLSDRRMRRLNREFHGRDCPTDVLAFSLGSDGEFLADIAISTDTAAANARKFRTTPLYESYLYLVHGMLHLLGYGDATPGQRLVMRRKEAEYLVKLHMREWR